MAVRIEKSGSVWTVIHDRPEARNAMDPASADALTAAFLEFDADKKASVAVFYGAGGAFCAGWDLKYVSTLDAKHPLGELDIPTAGARGNGGEIPRGPLGPSRLELDKPVIAAIEGPAVAGGMELGLWCDFRVMAKESYFGVYCRRWGVPLIDGGTVRLPRIVGQGRALEIILTGRKVPAEECLSIGLCEYVTAKGGARAEGGGARAGDRALPASLRTRRSPVRHQEPRAHRARGADSGMVQRPRGADRRRRGGRERASRTVSAGTATSRRSGKRGMADLPVFDLPSVRLAPMVAAEIRGGERQYCRGQVQTGPSKTRGRRREPYRCRSGGSGFSPTSPIRRPSTRRTTAPGRSRCGAPQRGRAAARLGPGKSGRLRRKPRRRALPFSVSPGALRSRCRLRKRSPPAGCWHVPVSRRRRRQ